MNKYGVTAVWAYKACVCKTCGKRAETMCKAEVLEDGRIGGVTWASPASGDGHQCGACKSTADEMVRKAYYAERTARKKQKAWIEKNSPFKPVKPKGQGA